MSGQSSGAGSDGAGGAAAESQAAAWLNGAALASGVRRAELLRAAAELLLHGASRALPVHLDALLAHAADARNDVRRHVLAAIEDISKLHPALLPRVVGPLRMLAIEGAVAVQKRAIQAASLVYRHALRWLCTTPAAQPQEQQHVWQHLAELKLIVLNLIDSDNEGIRTHSIKFLEEVVVLQTPSDDAAEPGDVCLARLPPRPFLDRAALEDEAEHIFALLLKFHNSPHVSSVNLMACTSTLCNVARARPALAARVIRALQATLAAPPPTLSASQENSVRKHLRAQLPALARRALASAAAADALPALAQLLADAGLSAQEVARAIPRERRAKRAAADAAPPAGKRVRVEPPAPPPAPATPPPQAPASPSPPAPATPPPPPPPAERALEDALRDAARVVRLVTATLVERLPAEMPPGFALDYEPVADAGSDAQRRRLARLLHALVAAAPEPESEPEAAPAPAAAPELEPEPEPERDEKATLRSAVAKLQESRLLEERRASHLRAEAAGATGGAGRPPPTPTVPRLKHKVQLLRLQEVTRPLPRDAAERLALAAVARVVRAEDAGGAARDKLLAAFASGFGAAPRALVLQHVLEAPERRLPLALAWLYEEYAVMRGFARLPAAMAPRAPEKHDLSYDRLLCALAGALLQRCGAGGEAAEALAARLYSAAPLVTDEAAELLRTAAEEPARAPHALRLLRDLCAARAPRAPRIVPKLLYHCLSEHADTRALALRLAAGLHARGAAAAAGAGGAGAGGAARLRAAVEKHALLLLGCAAQAAPPPELRAPRHQPWSDELYASCFALVLALLPDNEELVVEVARVYACCGAEARRVLLRSLEAPLRAAAGGAPAPGSTLPRVALALLAGCPRGADAVLTRLVQLLAERAPPGPELVQRVRDAYATRAPDVRLLVPVLRALEPQEVLAALPGLLRLSAGALRDVFAKLLGAPDDPGAGDHTDAPLTPTELLVALHLVEPAQCELKYTIRATALCFADKQLYTQDVVGAALQRLSARAQVPVLLLRSVLQALALFPALEPLVLNILHVLIDKEVWDSKVSWEGWVKCCLRLAPRSCYLLAALPARALPHVPPALRRALRDHLRTLAPPERALLPQHVAALLHERDHDDPVPPAATPPAPTAPGAEPLPPGME